MMGIKSVIILCTVFLLYNCIDPYTPKLRGYNSILVVDALITDENSSNTIKLSRTFQDKNMEPDMVSDANVTITDGHNNSWILTNFGNGLYKTDSLKFKGKTGENYTLHIFSGDGNEYESDKCTMFPVGEVDSVYYLKDQEITNNGTEIHDGIMIFLATKASGNNYRWSFDETWKFRVPFPKKFDYFDPKHIIRINNIKTDCWKTRKSDEILLSSAFSETAGKNSSYPICFIASNLSDRLLIEYSILVKQYSISNSEYEFWNNLKKVGETGDDIFASQPFPVISNIHNLKNPSDRVLGYFQVSAVKRKRKYITSSEIRKENFPSFQYNCERIARGPQDYPPGSGFTFDDIYNGFPPNLGYVFVAPEYDESNNLVRLVFTKVECADCEKIGTSLKPEFWKEID